MNIYMPRLCMYYRNICAPAKTAPVARVCVQCTVYGAPAFYTFFTHCIALQCTGYLMHWISAVTKLVRPMHYPAVKWREQSPDPHFSLFDNTWLCKEGQSTRNFRQRADVSTWCPFHIMPSSFVVTFSQFLWSAFILWNHLLLNWSGRRSVSRQLIGRHWYYSNHLREVRISVPGTRSRTPKQP